MLLSSRALYIIHIAPQKNKSKLITTKIPQNQVFSLVLARPKPHSVLHDKMRTQVAELDEAPTRTKCCHINPDVKLVLMFCQFTCFKMGQTFTAENTSSHLLLNKEHQLSQSYNLKPMPLLCPCFSEWHS